MSKQGEIGYLSKIGATGLEHALNKPFSDELCSRYLMQMGAVFALLPPPPAKMLDLGCGTGWTSIFMAKRGYEVLGMDIAPDMIANADRLKEFNGCSNLSFRVADYEEADLKELERQFDGVLFFDSLHHALDETKALRTAFRCLKPGGICVTVEPGIGHSKTAESLSIAEHFDTTEKEMYPAIIKEVGRKVGFRTINVFPSPDYLRAVIYRPLDDDHKRLKADVCACIDNKELNGLVVLHK